MAADQPAEVPLLKTIEGIVVERPVLHLVRDRTGTITARIGSGDAGSGEAAAPDLGPQVLEQLAGPRERDAPLGLLRELRIRGATVIVDDRRTGQTWRADRVDIAVERTPEPRAVHVPVRHERIDGCGDDRAWSAVAPFASDTHLQA
jgi:hypothetical protein